MNLEDMEKRLKQAFPDCDLVVSDLTGTGDHIEVRMAAKEFTGLSRVAQQRKVMDVFDVELKSGELHALALKLMAK